MDGAATFTADVACGIAGSQGTASSVVSHHTTGQGVACTVIFNGHVARGIAGGQGGTTIRFSRYAAGKGHALHCGRGAAPGDGTAQLSAYHGTCDGVAADAARHRAVFNLALKAPSRYAAGIAQTVIACYLYTLQHHVLHRAAGADTSEQTRIFVTSRNGQPRDGMVAAVEGAGVLVVIVYAYRRPVDAREVDVGRQGDIDA